MPCGIPPRESQVRHLPRGPLNSCTGRAEVRGAIADCSGLATASTALLQPLRARVIRDPGFHRPRALIAVLAATARSSGRQDLRARASDSDATGGRFDKRSGAATVSAFRTPTRAARSGLTSLRSCPRTPSIGMPCGASSRARRAAGSSWEPFPIRADRWYCAGHENVAFTVARSSALLELFQR